MYPADYHTHSLCSPDSSAPLENMAIAARRAGMVELCTTDHCDLQQEDGSVLEHWDWYPVLKQYDRALLLCPWPDFNLLLGIELGGGHTDPQRAADILAGAPLDFVIGTAASALAAAGMYAVRKLTVKGYPLLAMVLPALFNGLLVGWELDYVMGGGFWLNALYVAIGELAVLLTLGTALFYAIKKYSHRLFGNSI